VSESSPHSSRPRAAGSDPLVGAQIGPFTVVRQLGEGGMGVVYLARQEKPAREVALKILRNAVVSERMLRRFELEAEMLGRLHHPGIAQIHHAGTFATPQGPQPYFAMEFVDGKPVDVYARLHSLTLPQRLELAARICDAVQHAHTRGLVHRDLKPGNILVTADGQPKILDFGVARATGSDTQLTAHTEAGDLVGTLGYMSPEQISGEPDELDTRADVYALGVVLYELLTGQMPFQIDRKLLHEAVRIIREEEPRRLSTIDKVYRGDVETIVAKALEKEKSRRYQSASALAGDLRHFLADEPISARPASAFYQLVKFARRHRVACAALLAVAATLVIGAGVAIWQAVRANAAEREARDQARIASTNADEAHDQEQRAERNAARATAAERQAQEQARVADTNAKDALAQKQLAEQAAARATAQEQQARIQQRRAEQAAAFASDIFGGLSPYVANGQDTKLLKLVLAQAEARIATELHDAPEVEGAIRTTLGGAYTALGLYNDARAQLDRAAVVLTPFGRDHREFRNLIGAQARLQLRLGDFAAGTATFREQWERELRASGDDDRATIKAHDAYADALMRAGRYVDSVNEARAALATATRVFGAQESITLKVMTTLAISLAYLGDDQQAEAETLLRKVLECDRRDRGNDSLATWETAASLAMLLDHRDSAVEGEALGREALAQLARLLGPDHPQTLNVKNNIGVSLQMQDRQADAEHVFREVADARTRVLGADHPDTVFAWANIADTLMAQGRIDEAEPIVRTVIEARRKGVGPDHPQTLHSLKVLAEVIRAHGDFAAAAEVLGDVAASYRRTRKDGDRSLLVALYNWAATLQDAGDYDRAEPIFSQVVASHEQHGGKDDAFIAAAINGSAKCLDKKGESKRADEQFERALAMRRRLFRDGHVEIGYSLLDYGQALVDRGDWPAAERVTRDAVANAQKAKPPDAGALARAQALLGASLLGLDRVAEAEPLLLQAEPVLAADASVRAQFLRWLRLRLAALFDARERAEPGKGNASAAASWREKAGAAGDK
jgi:tRNA A-37 threonylcarbamoyl transferase component Bud32